MDKYTISEQLKILLKRKGITARELAERLGTTPQNLQNKITRDDFKISDIEKMAEALGVRFVYGFEEIKKD